MPRPETVDKAIAEIGKSVANYRYFFEKLNAPGWLRPLADRGRFDHPPTLIEVEGGFLFPGWPESQYLARMAKLPEAQAEVLRIALAIPQTDNAMVHADLLNVALAIPAAEAAQLADRIASWVQQGHENSVAMKIGEFIAHLATGGQGRAALRLAAAAFALKPQPAAQEEQEWAPSPEPQAYLRDWYYEHALEAAFAPLVAVDPQATFVLVCDLLDQAIALSRGPAQGEARDYSYIWRSAIERDEQPAQLRSILVSAVRDAANIIVQGDRAALATVLAELRRHSWTVFKRLEYHTLAGLAAHALPEIEGMAVRLADLAYETRHEAARLLRAAFAQLSPETQEAVLEWIATNPTDEEIAERFTFAHQEQTPDAVAKFKQQWRAQRYVLFANEVPAAWRARVEETLAAAGEVPAPDELEDEGGWVGPTSPKSSDDLEALGPVETIRFLREWQAPEGHLVETPEGLGRVLEGVIAQHPEEYIARAADVEGLDPTFVRFFFSGIETAVREHRAVMWEPVLELAAWVMAQPREIPGRHRTLMEADEGWQWTRGAIARLLERGLNARPPKGNEPPTSPIPFAARDAVWAVLEPITHDPDPTPEYEAKYGGENMDPPTLAINSLRGKAMNAVMAYALWVRYNLDQLADRPASTFAVMPEVRQVLDNHLNTIQDPSLAIRSIYGQFFPHLHLMDPTWAQEAVPRIFPRDDDAAHFWNAAWSAYLMFARPYDNILPLLSDQYARAVRELGAATKKRGFSPEERLAEHLMAYYWRNQLALDAPLVQDFFRTAPDAVRAHAITFIGRSLPQNRPIEEDVRTRLRALWDARVAWARVDTHAAQCKDELSQFGWWFSSQQFDTTWSFEQVRMVLALVNGIQPEFKVAETIEALAPQFPLKAIETVRLMAAADRKGWELYANEKHFKNIITTALASGNAQARTAADDLIQYFITRGHFGYRALLG